MACITSGGARKKKENGPKLIDFKLNFNILEYKIAIK